MSSNWNKKNQPNIFPKVLDDFLLHKISSVDNSAIAQWCHVNNDLKPKKRT